MKKDRKMEKKTDKEARGRGRPPHVYKVTTPCGDVPRFEGAALTARVLGVAKQTIYNAISGRKTANGCKVELEER